MPRTSVEERAASFYRAASRPLAPPRGLSAREKAIWLRIVNAKPPDWFDGGSLGILTDYCRAEAESEALWRRLRALEPGSIERARVMAEHKAVRSSLTQTARELRLSVQHAIDRREAKAGERQPAAAGDALIGGAAVRTKIRIVE